MQFTAIFYCKIAIFAPLPPKFSRLRRTFGGRCAPGPAAPDPPPSASTPVSRYTSSLPQGAPPWWGNGESFLSATRPPHNLVTDVTLIMWDRVSSIKYCCSFLLNFASHARDQLR